MLVQSTFTVPPDLSSNSQSKQWHEGEAWLPRKRRKARQPYATCVVRYDGCSGLFFHAIHSCCYFVHWGNSWLKYCKTERNITFNVSPKNVTRFYSLVRFQKRSLTTFYGRHTAQELPMAPLGFVVLLKKWHASPLRLIYNPNSTVICFNKAPKECWMCYWLTACQQQVRKPSPPRPASMWCNLWVGQPAEEQGKPALNRIILAGRT